MLCKTKVIEKKEDEQNIQDPKHCTCKDFTVFHIFWNFMFTNDAVCGVVVACMAHTPKSALPAAYGVRVRIALHDWPGLAGRCMKKVSHLGLQGQRM